MALIETCPHCGEAIMFALGKSPDQPNEIRQKPLKQLDLRRVDTRLGQFAEDGCFLGWLE
jgi:hypothetical protein